MDEICSGRIYRKNCHDCGQGIQVLRLGFGVASSVLSSQFQFAVIGGPS
jgi:hypothetical protein